MDEKIKAFNDEVRSDSERLSAFNELDEMNKEIEHGYKSMSLSTTHDIPMTLDQRLKTAEAHVNKTTEITDVGKEVYER